MTKLFTWITFHTQSKKIATIKQIKKCNDFAFTSLKVIHDRSQPHTIVFGSSRLWLCRHHSIVFICLFFFELGRLVPKIFCHNDALSISFHARLVFSLVLSPAIWIQCRRHDGNNGFNSASHDEFCWSNSCCRNRCRTIGHQGDKNVILLQDLLSILTALSASPLAWG